MWCVCAVQVSILDDSGYEVPRGTIGNISVRGCPVFKGYEGDEKATGECATVDNKHACVCSSARNAQFSSANHRNRCFLLWARVIHHVSL